MLLRAFPRLPEQRNLSVMVIIVIIAARARAIATVIVIAMVIVTVIVLVIEMIVAIVVINELELCRPQCSSSTISAVANPCLAAVSACRSPHQPLCPNYRY